MRSNLSLDEATQVVQRVVNLHTKKVKKNNSTQEIQKLLKDWSLTNYLSSFENNGCTDIEDWKDLTLEELKSDINMKIGHAKKFLRLVNAYFTKDQFI